MQKQFNYCPHCGASSIEIYDYHRLHCSQCDFVYFHNVATATAIIIRRGNELLFCVRNKEPMLGKLDLPGGFVDPKESAEEGAQRELKEELNLDIPVENLRYYRSQPNKYLYKDVEYRTCDLAFIANFPENAALNLEDNEIQSIRWIAMQDVNLQEIGFESLRRIVQQYIEENK
ncbi:NUDIX hydrolase [Weeksella virosa]|uniref:NUDIX hydrolase n=1 Tax=Weeksella virosa (strain ATCC 43766 / DSM 16922 / JCM 21250 / CCUG 30538 / CDC 9751 / IAM 14551 / NBRC 16016 / NCTC 11634 / CL345/78) TaxID=865938 RepID=F0P0R7_WEEVC|nr:NUDIX domain-containing protein [Weeksella virosa]ADX67481.1 NUDIX hydrolase [Weeksella virosa DSM 16922]SUP53775.1 Bifunctional NMN adenylyltransferase/Nudix hydrolase [Weeksella virosa]VEH62776.1 Bifunctional NMN adenylyltransferase/Nudix hydrolase [Weeksella virosa]